MKSARELVALGYYQVSRQYRQVAQLGPDDLPVDATTLQLDAATFEEFRRLGGTAWWNGVLARRQNENRCKFLEVLAEASMSPQEVLRSEMTMRQLFARLGGAVPESDMTEPRKEKGNEGSDQET